MTEETQDRGRRKRIGWAVGLIAAVISWVWPKMPAAAGLLHAAGAPTELGTVAWLAIGAWVILAPVALYFVFARE